MPAIIDKIADALHLRKHHHEHRHEADSTSAAPAKAPEPAAAEPAPAVKPSASAAKAPDAAPAPASETVPTPATEDSPAADAAPKTPVFDNSQVSVIFVLGGPGAGKGTQCANLVKDFGFCHLSAGDLLRAEQNREGSEHGEMIRTYIKEGQVVPMEVTIKLLENAMRAALAERQGDGWDDGRGRFLIDGFPRKMDQAVKFDEDVCLSSLVMYFDTTEEEMTKRLLERGKTSGREDDNQESIKKRFVTYRQTTMPVIEYYSKQGKVSTIDSTVTIEEVHEKARAVIEKLFAGQFTQNVAV